MTATADGDPRGEAPGSPTAEHAELLLAAAAGGKHLSRPVDNSAPRDFDAAHNDDSMSDSRTGRSSGHDAESQMVMERRAREEPAERGGGGAAGLQPAAGSGDAPNASDAIRPSTTAAEQAVYRNAVYSGQVVGSEKYASTKIASGSDVICQETLLSVIIQPGNRDLEIPQLFSFWRPRMSLHPRRSSALNMSTKQLDIMYALAGCSDVMFTISRVMLEVRAACEQVYGIDKDMFARWFKNRGSPRASVTWQAEAEEQDIANQHRSRALGKRRSPEYTTAGHSPTSPQGAAILPGQGSQATMVRIGNELVPVLMLNGEQRGSAGTQVQQQQGGDSWHGRQGRAGLSFGNASQLACPALCSVPSRGQGQQLHTVKTSPDSDVTNDARAAVGGGALRAAVNGSGTGVNGVGDSSAVPLPGTLVVSMRQGGEGEPSQVDVSMTLDDLQMLYEDGRKFGELLNTLRAIKQCNDSSPKPPPTMSVVNQPPQVYNQQPVTSPVQPQQYMRAGPPMHTNGFGLSLAPNLTARHVDMSSLQQLQGIRLPNGFPGALVLGPADARQLAGLQFMQAKLAH
uniref:Uncharacterized protein n=1 Tax=Chlamydomonas euryale TaxID=1486919 RepID=A0A7R9YRC3_9CHLO|mmetsp:Transcript_12974/g.37683  ORF Transcript_12974/g.37683 Transcript_12974/m.37683 type:complete len:570 (+) Transcript_12974:189-1898(+)